MIESKPNTIIGKTLEDHLSYEELKRAAGKDLFGPELGILLQRLHRFASQIHTESFGSVIETVAGEASTELVEEMAHALSQDICGRSRMIADKSLQETLFYCTGVEPDLPRHEFGKQLETFLELHGSKGLIGLFLRLHLFNLIWIDLQDGSTVNRVVDARFSSRLEDLDRICDAAASASIRPWVKWPPLNEVRNAGHSVSAATTAPNS